MCAWLCGNVLSTPIHSLCFYVFVCSLCIHYGTLFAAISPFWILFDVYLRFRDLSCQTHWNELSIARCCFFFKRSLQADKLNGLRQMLCYASYVYVYADVLSHVCLHQYFIYLLSHTTSSKRALFHRCLLFLLACSHAYKQFTLSFYNQYFCSCCLFNTPRFARFVVIQFWHRLTTQITCSRIYFWIGLEERKKHSHRKHALTHMKS